MPEDYVHKLQIRRAENGRFEGRVSILAMRRSERFDNAIQSRPIDVDMQTIFAFLSTELGAESAKGYLDDAATGSVVTIVLPLLCPVNLLQSE